MKKKIKRLFGRVVSIVVCLICSLTIFACVPPPYVEDSGGSGGTRPPETPGVKPPRPPFDWGDIDFGDTSTIEDYNSVFMGAIGVFEADRSAKVYYDKYQKLAVSFDDITDRMFNTMTDYLFDSLNRIYGLGTGDKGSISGYGTSKTYNYSSAVNSDIHNAVTSLTSQTVTNIGQLSYKNSINGGYKLNTPTTTSDDSGEVDAEGQPIQTEKYAFNGYSTELVADNSWKNATVFSKEYIKNALMDIYINLDNSTAISNIDSFDFNNNNLKTAYKNYVIKNSLTKEKIKVLKISKEYLWNVAYFLGYTVIGESNLNNSMLPEIKNIIFEGSNIRALQNISEENHERFFSAFQNYKGYDEVIKSLVFNMPNLIVSTASTLSFGSDYFATKTDTTLFPVVSLLNLEYYDDVTKIADGENQDEDFDFDSDADSDSEPGKGMPKRLKEIIYLPNITLPEISSFIVANLGMGFASVSGKFDLSIKFDAIFTGSNKIEGKDILFEDISGGFDNPVSLNKIEINSKYLSEDMESGNLFSEDELKDLGDKKFGNFKLKSKDEDSSKNAILGAFTNMSYKTSYNVDFNRGLLNVYNDILDNDGMLALDENYLRIYFSYPGETQIPSMYMMYLSIYD